jgi:hypothetical protein
VKKLLPSLVGKVQFLLLTIGMGMFNVVTMVDRFVNRPERDETQEFNLTVIFLAWVEITYVAIWGGCLMLYVLYALCVGVKKSCVAPEKKDTEIDNSMEDVDAAGRLRTAAFLLNKLLTITVLKGLGGAYRRLILPIWLARRNQHTCVLYFSNWPQV